MVAATLLASPGCAGPQQEAHPYSDTVPERVEAIHEASEQKDRSAVPWLVDALRHSDAVVRLAAIRALETITGQTYGYNAYAPRAKRDRAIARWVQAVSGSEE